MKTRPIRFAFDGDDTEPSYPAWDGGPNMGGIDVYITFETLADIAARDISILNCVDVGPFSEGYFVNEMTRIVVNSTADRVAPYDGPLILVSDCSFHEVPKL